MFPLFVILSKVSKIRILSYLRLLLYVAYEGTKIRKYFRTFESYVYNVLYFRTIIHVDHSTRTDDTMVYVLSESVLCSDSA